MKTVFLILLFALHTMAATVRLSDYATPDDNLNDSSGFQSAVNYLKANKGGTLIVDDGEWDLHAMVNFTNDDHLSFKIVSDGGATIKIGLGSGGSNNYAFYVGNVNQFVMENLTFVGDGSASNVDCQYLLFVNYAQKTIVRDSRFFGIRATTLLHFGNINALVENSQFEGNAVTQAQIYGAPEILGLTVRNTNFRDYAGFFGYVSKTAANTGNVIFVDRQAETPAAYLGSRVRLEDLRIDEGSPIAIKLKNVPSVEISGLNVNVSGLANSAGILFDNVKYGRVSNSAFGYTTNERPALKLINSTTVYLDHVLLGESVFYGERDSGSQAFFNLKACSSGCVLNVL